MASVGDIVGVVIFLIAIMIIGCAGLVRLVNKIYSRFVKSKHTTRESIVATGQDREGHKRTITISTSDDAEGKLIQIDVYNIIITSSEPATKRRRAYNK